MEQIIKGASLGAYKTVGAAIDKGTYNNGNEEVEFRYVKLSVRDEYTPSAQPRAMMLFCQSSPEIQDLYDILKNHLKKNDQGVTEKDRQGCSVINWRELKKSDDWEEIEDAGWTRFPGADVKRVPLKKGMCYRNDRQGNILNTKEGNPITADAIEVLTIVKDLRMNEEGQLTPNYVSGWDPFAQRDQMEQRFYRIPVESNPTIARNLDNQVSASVNGPMVEAANEVIDEL